MSGPPLAPRQGSSGNVALQISNQCPGTIWPAVYTMSGSGNSNTGFSLSPGGNKTVYVPLDWQGRVWGRSNCSFSSNGQASSGNGQACTTGDCGGVLACKSPGTPPATLAEFTMNGSSSQTFYDISLVDGYNLPLAIVLNANGISALQSLDPSTTNPSCVASVGDMASEPFDPYSNGQQFLGTSSSDPLPFDNTTTVSDVADWCPWDLQVNPPQAPGDGVYPYPDTNVARPAFDPCYSACAKYNQDNYCCTGQYDSVNTCSPNYYSKAAKSVCPDAYAYAFDDSTSTFVVPSGGGYSIIFCPGGRSTNIIASKGTGAITHGSSSPSNSTNGRLRIDETAKWVALLTLTLMLLF